MSKCPNKNLSKNWTGTFRKQIKMLTAIIAGIEPQAWKSSTLTNKAKLEA